MITAALVPQHTSAVDITLALIYTLAGGVVAEFAPELHAANVLQTCLAKFVSSAYYNPLLDHGLALLPALRHRCHTAIGSWAAGVTTMTAAVPSAIAPHARCAIAAQLAEHVPQSASPPPCRAKQVGATGNLLA